MYCTRCGSILPEDANFCHKCGTPQKEDMKVEEPKYDTCEIVFAVIKNTGAFSRGKMKFWAKAYGTDQTYTVGESDIFDVYIIDEPPVRGKQYDLAATAINNLEEKLMADGWEYTGRYGNYYWQKKFRRKAK